MRSPMSPAWAAPRAPARRARRGGAARPWPTRGASRAPAGDGSARTPRSRQAQPRSRSLACRRGRRPCSPRPLRPAGAAVTSRAALLPEPGPFSPSRTESTTCARSTREMWGQRPSHCEAWPRFGPLSAGVAPGAPAPGRPLRSLWEGARTGASPGAVGARCSFRCMVTSAPFRCPPATKRGRPGRGAAPPLGDIHWDGLLCGLRTIDAVRGDAPLMMGAMPGMVCLVWLPLPVARHPRDRCIEGLPCQLEVALPFTASRSTKATAAGASSRLQPSPRSRSMRSFRGPPSEPGRFLAVGLRGPFTTMYPPRTAGERRGSAGKARPGSDGHPGPALPWPGYPGHGRERPGHGREPGRLRVHERAGRRLPVVRGAR